MPVNSPNGQLMNSRRTGTPARCPAELQEPDKSSRTWELFRFSALRRPGTFWFVYGGFKFTA
jgi:hypothetical protein